MERTRILKEIYKLKYRRPGFPERFIFIKKTLIEKLIDA